MLIYLDSDIVIYAVEGTPHFGQRAETRITCARGNGDQFVITELSRLECRVHPLARGDSKRLALFDLFFSTPDLQIQPLTTAVCDRATLIRAQHRYETPDALHLAAALEAQCARFLTNEARLAGFGGITVELLP